MGVLRLSTSVRSVAGILVLVLLYFLPMPSRAAGQSTSSPPRAFKVPIYFVTDRNVNKTKFGGRRKYVVNCEHHPFYGQAFPIIENVLNEKTSDQSELRQWHASTRRRERVARKTVVKLADPEMREKQFFEQLKKVVAKSSNKELYIFVHGYCTNFELAARKAGEFAYYSKQPTVLYSWPSVGKVFSYRIDEGNVEWSLEHFRMFINNLAKYQVTEPRKIFLVAHSLANRMLSWSGDELVSSKLFKQIVMVSPDVDNETFKHYLLRYRDQGTATGYILVSFRDGALPISQLIHGGYFRLGEGIGSIFNLVSNSSEFMSDKILHPLSSDGNPNPDLGQSENDTSQTKSIEPQESRFRLIDFTALDRGFIGHSIPAQLIVNLCETGKPGENLGLEPSQARNRKFLAGLLRSAVKYGTGTGQDKQAMEKVVYVKPGKS